MPRPRRAVLSVAMIGALLGVSTADARLVGASGCVGSAALAAAESAAESQFVSRLDALRSTSGLGPLPSSTPVSRSSDEWSKTMASRSVLQHDPDLRSKLHAIVSDLTAGGENVGRTRTYGWCTSSELTAEVDNAVDRLHRAFIESPSHHRNMVGSYNQVGVGVELAPANSG